MNQFIDQKTDFDLLAEMSKLVDDRSDAMRLAKNSMAAARMLQVMDAFANIYTESDMLQDSYYGIKNSKDTSPRNYSKAKAKFKICHMRALLWTHGEPVAAAGFVARGMSVVGGKFMIEGKLQASIAKSSANILFEHKITTLDAKAVVNVMDWSTKEQKKKTLDINDMELLIWATVDGEVVKNSDGTKKQTKLTLSQVYKHETWGGADVLESRLIYRGYREWINQHRPDILDGCYLPEQIAEMGIKDVTPSANSKVNNHSVDILSKITLPSPNEDSKKTTIIDHHTESTPQDVVLESDEKQYVVPEVLVFVAEDGMPYSVKKTAKSIKNLLDKIELKDKAEEFITLNSQDDLLNLEQAIDDLPIEEKIDLKQKFQDLFCEKSKKMMIGS